MKFTNEYFLAKIVEIIDVLTFFFIFCMYNGAKHIRNLKVKFWARYENMNCPRHKKVHFKSTLPIIDCI